MRNPGFDGTSFETFKTFLFARDELFGEYETFRRKLPSVIMESGMLA